MAINPNADLRGLVGARGLQSAAGDDLIARSTPGGQRRLSVLTVSTASRAWFYGTIAMIGIGAALGNGPLFALGVLLATALGAAWLWSRWCLRNLFVERRLSQTRAFWGEEIDMAQIFTNHKPLPLPWVAVEDTLPGTLDVAASSGKISKALQSRLLDTSLSIGWYERVIRHYTLRCTARGEHAFGPIDLQSGDVFGLFRRTETVETPQTLVVYPRYVPVERLSLPARQPFGDFKAVQDLASDPLRIRGIREYALGDSPRFIHWKATARRAQLQTKLFDPAATPQLFIFCNQDTFTRMWEGIDTATLELTITVAASLANHALEMGYMVGLQVNAFASTSDQQVKIHPSRSPEQLTRILESLARVRGWSGLSMEDLIQAERRSLPIGSTVVVVTGVVPDEMLDVLTALRRAGHPVTLVETAGSERAEGWEQRVPADALRAQGITYYQVEAIGDEAKEMESLSF